MSYKFFGAKKGIAIALITIVLAVSSSIFVAPRPVHAQLASEITAIAKLIVQGLDWVANLASKVSAADTALSANAMWAKEYVLDPLAWVMSQKSLQSITGSIVNFVNGKGNGGGKQFVQNLQGNLQTVGTTQALAFFAQFGARGSKSPFDSAIVSSLKEKYLQGTTLAGFFSANKSTLSKFSPDVNRFLAGDWSQGGAAAWFALTTQDENNPYTLYQSAQNQLSELVASAQETRKSVLSWGQGMMSWCGNNANTIDTGGGGIESGDPCINSDGTPGSIQTPGSVIQSQLSSALGAGINKIVSADELSEVLGNIAMSFAVNILGGSSGGLAGAAEPSSTGGRSLVSSLINENPTNPTDPTTIIHQKLSKVETYKKNWDEINKMLLYASSTVKIFQDHCLSEAGKAKGLIAKGGINGVDLNAFISTANRLAGEANDALSNGGAIYDNLFQAAKRNQLVIDIMTLIGKIQYEAGSTTATDSITSIGAEKPNLTKYTTALASVVKTDYSTASWSTYWDFIIDKTNATSVKNVVTTANSQTEVEFATNAIKTAQTNLARSGNTNLKTYKDTLSAVKEADYIPESWSKYQIIVAANIVTADNTQKEIDIAVAKIIDAQIDLIPKEGVTASTANSNNSESLRKQLAADLTTLQEMPPTANDVANSTAQARESKNVGQVITPKKNSLEMESIDSESIKDLMIMYISLTQEGYNWTGNIWDACTMPTANTNSNSNSSS